jgi:hypothetical protein
VRLWRERFRLVVVDACGCWERGAGCDESEKYLPQWPFAGDIVLVETYLES